MKKTILKLPFCLLCPLYLVVLMIGCQKDNDSPQSQSDIDYSLPERWLYLPQEATTLKLADSFYLYPTTAHDTLLSVDHICLIDDPQMETGAASAFARQASAFVPVGNIYAPFYRQADVPYILNISSENREKIISQIPSYDAIAAFDYYINHYNNGRPFILAGHSQGSNVLRYVIQNYLLNHKDVYNRMIAAYLIGYPVTKEFIEEHNLQFATGADDTGVIISYNTQAPDVLPGTNPVVGNIVGQVINPISWTCDETVAPKEDNLGSVLPDLQTMQPYMAMNYADAKIDLTQGVLICSTADEDGLSVIPTGFSKGIYHSFDYPFYYVNLQQNAANRVSQFFRNQDR